MFQVCEQYRNLDMKRMPQIAYKKEKKKEETEATESNMMALIYISFFSSLSIRSRAGTSSFVMYKTEM